MLVLTPELVPVVGYFFTGVGSSLSVLSVIWSAGVGSGRCSTLLFFSTGVGSGCWAFFVLALPLCLINSIDLLPVHLNLNYKKTKERLKREILG